MEQLIRDIGRRVCEQRRGLRMTQERLAERLAVSVKYVQRVEAGGENLTVRSLVRLAEALGVPVIALFRTPLDRGAMRGRPRGSKSPLSSKRKGERNKP